jgi:hypothetical protein
MAIYQELVAHTQIAAARSWLVHDYNYWKLERQRWGDQRRGFHQPQTSILQWSNPKATTRLCIAWAHLSIRAHSSHVALAKTIRDHKPEVASEGPFQEYAGKPLWSQVPTLVEGWGGHSAASSARRIQGRAYLRVTRTFTEWYWPNQHDRGRIFKELA